MFLIFLMTVFALIIIGMALWWIWCKIYRSIERDDESFKVEKETYKKIRKIVREDEQE